MDISEINSPYLQKHIETLKNENEDLKKAFECSYDGIWICDSEGVTLSINKAIERITGLKKEEVTGRSMIELVEKGIFDQSATLKALEEKNTVTIMQKVISGISTIVTANPIFDQSGNIKKVISNVRDITELIQLREQLQKLEEEKNKYQSELNSLLHHIEEVNDIVLKSPNMKKVIEKVMQVAKYDTTVVLLGESGTGKEVMAQLIHDSSPRKEKGEFIRVNCSAIPAELLESEMFGYESGAFTGAKKSGKPGLIELAHDGTLFLDEIGELPLNIQAKFLRAIQEKEIMRLGGVTPIKVNFRIIAATNRNLNEMVASRTFREDLFYRLHVVPVTIPPLRSRKDDIPKLIESFTNTFNKYYHTEKCFSPEAIRMLIDYPWPGNVRELKNIVERMFVTTSSDTIYQKDLPDFLLSHAKPGASYKNGSLKEQLAQYERELLQNTLRVSTTTYEAAALLGIDQSTVVRKMKKYQLSL
ncbi:sigma-54-dependent Fis family transcriptional regulator [Siminovitchia terrae]|uniref:sigma-54 interaction domain-containing protein n=1 Tax=Siminovitchia terrae TaxID=1914933 RepID=UPI001B247D4F|nr:sigma 54-interacting transcriptional regulator [Siminovitchia terrae]GIN93826.1 sigma-54-dependent Fis family transcriptional regulator [Siminovitchia terrae]